MFRCNNQTQFNQKTQNCDWWYNVNCGGRLGSPSDFEQSQGAIAQASNENFSDQPQQNRQRQQDRDTAASSNEEQLRTATGGAELAADGQQFRGDATGGSNDNEQKVSEGSREDLSGGQTNSFKRPAEQSNRWSVTSPVKFADTSSQEDSDPRADLFHHSESATNITVAPGVARQQDQVGQQQAAPTSSTPIYGRQGAEPDSVQSRQQGSYRQEEFSERSSTTRDPLLAQSLSGSNELSTGGLVSTEVSGGSSSTSTESRPQVGAILTNDNDQLMQSLAATLAQDAAGNTTVNNDISVTTGSSSTISDSTNQPLTTSSIASSTISESPSTPPVAANEATTESGQLEQSNLVQEQAANKSRRLVQSEFGLGVQQKQLHRESGAKSARSTARFEFVRNPSAGSSGDALFSGQLTQFQSGVRFNGFGEQQAPNHKYSSRATSEPSSGSQIYSTSANQGSVSYNPIDEQDSSQPMSTSRNQDEQSSNSKHQKSAQTSHRSKLNRRFGARLPVNLTAKQQVAATPTNAR